MKDRPHLTLPPQNPRDTSPPSVSYLSRVQESVNALKAWRGALPLPEMVVVLGSGLADAVDGLDNLACARFEDIPGFRTTHVLGHRSELRVGRVECVLPDGRTGSREVAFLRGRNHAYEGFDAGEVVHNVRTLLHWGAKGVLLTNAAGCLDISWPVGSLMVLSDHINFTGLNPLAYPYGAGFEPRFVDMGRCYDAEWRSELKSLARAQGLTMNEGTYFGVLGPTYETPAEIRMMQTLGAHAVGMSTVLEAIAARQLGARVAAVSCFTNHGAGLSPEAVLDHADVLDVGKASARGLAKLLLAAAVSLPL
jgi:purine-nucleoside phosphorylase